MDVENIWSIFLNMNIREKRLLFENFTKLFPECIQSPGALSKSEMEIFGFIATLIDMYKKYRQQRRQKDSTTSTILFTEDWMRKCNNTFADVLVHTNKSEDTYSTKCRAHNYIKGEYCPKRTYVGTLCSDHLNVIHGVRIEWISNEIGYGVFAMKHFSPGDVLSTYIGTTHTKESIDKTYGDDDSVFVKFAFCNHDGTFCVDGRDSRTSYVRYINDYQNPIKLAAMPNIKCVEDEYAKTFKYVVIEYIKPGEQFLVNYCT